MGICKPYRDILFSRMSFAAIPRWQTDGFCHRRSQCIFSFYDQLTSEQKRSVVQFIFKFMQHYNHVLVDSLSFPSFSPLISAEFLPR